jgi:ABC-type bacteriocin/lantibiotic exporter with double-glycine peptidase domain
MSGQDPLHRLQELIHIEREDIIVLLAYGIGIGVLSLATPVAVQALVNTIAFGALLQPLVVLTLVLLVLLAFSNSLVALQFYVVEMLQRRLLTRFFGEAARRLQRATIACRSNVYLPELTNRFFDVAALQKSAASMLLETMGYVLQTLIGMILLAFYHPMLLALDLFLILSLYVVLFIMGKGSIPTVIEQSKAKYAAAAWLENIAANPLLGKSRSEAEFIGLQTRRLAEDYLTASVKHFRILSRQNIGALVLHTLANTALLGMGGWMVIERQLSLGQLIAAELVVNAMIYGFTRLGKTLDNFYTLVASMDKIGYLLDLPQEHDDHDAELQTGSGPLSLEIKQLTLPEAPQQDSIKSLDLKLAASDSLVISAGAEHGSFLDALFGLRIPASGQIQFDGQDLRDLSLGALRDQISLVRQGEVIDADVADNINMGRGIEPEKIRAALDQVGLLEDIVALPDSLNTRLYPQGMPLNGEKCLRLTLARAIAMRPRLLLIDRVLDRIDQRWLPRILDSLFAADAGWTLIVVSQDARVIARCRYHAQIHNGQLTWMGEKL